MNLRKHRQQIARGVSAYALPPVKDYFNREGHITGGTHTVFFDHGRANVEIRLYSYCVEAIVKGGEREHRMTFPLCDDTTTYGTFAKLLIQWVILVEAEWTVADVA